MNLSIVARVFVLGSLAALSTLGCAAPTEEEGPEVVPEENVDSVAQALTDPCATGSTSNYEAPIAVAWSSASYTRGAAWINPGPICGSNARDTTIVDFRVHPDNQRMYYQFTVTPVWGNVPLNDCTKLKLSTRIQKKNRQTGAWEQIAYSQLKPGVLRFDPSTVSVVCDVPTYTFGRVNAESNAQGTRRRTCTACGRSPIARTAGSRASRSRE